MAITPGDDTRGIARPDRLGRLFTLERFAAAPPLDRFVDHFWTASWDLPEGQSHHQKVVAHPVVNLVFENGRGSLSGVITETFVRELADRERPSLSCSVPVASVPSWGGPCPRSQTGRST